VDTWLDEGNATPGNKLTYGIYYGLVLVRTT
jgi:hypothetical protein